MCGISGAFSASGVIGPEVREAVRRMNLAIAHRGPDEDGFYDGPGVTLANRRLAIIDIAHGQQPMSNEDGSCWLVFNGQIYNHRDLRPELESRGHVFRTKSDTEVIVHAWEEYGPECVERLEGMFAFAVYDTRSREFFAARDRLGKKPFFYTVLDDVLYFASELPALRHAPGWRGDVDTTAIEGYLSLGYFLAPRTIYREVHKLMPGHWLRIRGDGPTTRMETRQYWDVTEFDTDTRPDEQLIDTIDETLRAAVHSRLQSEVPLGAFLSGGIDSGLVVSYMAEALDDRLVTTSVGFGDAEHNELPAARVVATHFGARHYEQVIEPNLEEAIGPVTSHLGEPLADSSAIPTWYVSGIARRHVTVALSGDGGDEVFAGYDFRYVPHAIEARARRFVLGGRSALLGWLGANWPRSPRLPRPLRLGSLLENLGRDPAGAYYADLAFLDPHEARRLMGLEPDRAVERSPVYAAVTEPYRRCPSTDALQRAEYADLKVYMPNDPLVKVDRMSMAHSLEVRCPLLDRRVVELGFRIPASRKQVGGTGKVLLRALARRRLPEGLWTLPKRGFTVPVSSWIAGPHAGMFRDEVLSPSARLNGHVDRAVVSRWFERNRAEGGPLPGYVLWNLWVLERWLRGALTL